MTRMKTPLPYGKLLKVDSEKLYLLTVTADILPQGPSRQTAHKALLHLMSFQNHIQPSLKGSNDQEEL